MAARQPQPSRVVSQAQYAASLVDAALDGAGVSMQERAAMRNQVADALSQAEQSPATAAIIIAEMQVEVKRVAFRARQNRGETATSGVAPDPSMKKSKAARPGRSAADQDESTAAVATPHCPSTTPIVHPAMKPSAAAQPKGLTTRADQITLFCVYSGNGGQRAKAFVVDRRQPDFAGIMRSLEAKFKASLSLGYISIETGEYVEITDEFGLSSMIQSEHGASDSVTMYCWSAAAAGRSASDRGDAISERSSPAVSERSAVTPNKRTKSSRPASAQRGAASVRSSGSRAPSAARDTNNPLNVSGACYNEEQLRELFDELDVDGSGTLDREEFRRYFFARYDDMGVGDADRKFDKLLRSCPGFEDGVLTFDEFAIVMLKLAQW